MDEPEIESQDIFYLKAFYDLNTCRAGGMGLCPIPWRDIVHYAEFYELDCDIVEAFIDIIRDMDGAYMEWQNDEAERKKPKPKPPPPR